MSLQNAVLWLCSVAIILMAACADARLPLSPTEVSPVVEATAISGVPQQADAVPTTHAEALVIKVVDGDTIDVQLAAGTERVRIIGIDSPETVDPNRSVQCFGPEASAKAKELLGGKQVRLVADVSQGERDATRQRRLLRYVDLPDGTDFGLWMISNGYAKEYTYDDPYQRQAQYMEGERVARERRLGLWSSDTCGGGVTQPWRGAMGSAPTDSSYVATPKPAKQAQSYPTRLRTATLPDLGKGFDAGQFVGRANRYDCPDFASQAQAQAVLRADPGDPNLLDNDRDGMACETNPPPYDRLPVSRP